MQQHTFTETHLGSQIPSLPPDAVTITPEEEQKLKDAFNQSVSESLSGMFPPGKQIVVYVDTDIPIYKAAAVSDNHKYIVGGEYCRYKSDALALAKEKGFSSKDVVSTYDPYSPLVAAAVLAESLKTFEKQLPDAIFVYTISSDNNFRKTIYDKYKKSRENKRKPVNLSVLKDYAVAKFNAISLNWLEADDVMGIYSSIPVSEEIVNVIATIDKDLDCVPGYHWNPAKDLVYTVNEFQAFYNFCRQVLMGDTTDDIPGLFRVGAKSADKMLKGCDSTESMWQVVRSAYETKKPGDSDFEGTWEEYLDVMSQLIWIHRDFEKGYSSFLPGRFRV